MCDMDFTLESKMTLTEWLMYWLEDYVRPVVKPSTYESYRNSCEAHIIPKLGSLKLTEISAKIVQRFFNQQAQSGHAMTGGPLSAKTLRNLRTVLDVAMKQALAEGLIPSNPIPLTVIRSCRTKQLEVMTDTMQETLERYLFEIENHFHGAILMALYTGLRRGEVCALRWKDYNEATGVITVTETVRRLTNYDAKPGEARTKLVFNEVKTAAASRTLLMPEILREVLRNQKMTFAKEFRIPQGNDFIFFSKAGGILDPDNLQHYFTLLLKRLGIEHVKFHALRHTFATRAIENGIDVATVSGILGHANVTTTTRFYVHPREKAMRRAMQSITPIYNGRSAAPERKAG